jgi:hypothetical protein
MTPSAITRTVKGIVRKHYGKCKHFKTRGWEQCGIELERLIDREQTFFSLLPYSEQCAKKDRIRRDIEREYYSYFQMSNGYFCWISGNSKLKELLDY